MSNTNYLRTVLVSIIALLFFIGLTIAAFGHGGMKHKSSSKETTKPHHKPKPKKKKKEKKLLYRGCPSCHIKTNGDDYTLWGDVKRVFRNHRVSAPSGKPLNENTQVETCLECHAAKSNGKGIGAERSLRDIVHPAHLFSKDFQELNGTCFSCHNVEWDGRLVLLSRKIATNSKGIPKKVPIPGALRIRTYGYVSMNVFIGAVSALGLLNLLTLGLAYRRKNKS